MLGRSLIAIDIGSSSVKIVELAGGRQRKLRALGLELIPPGAVVDGVIREEDVVKAVIAKLLERLRISPTGRRAAISLNGSSVMIKKVSIEAAPSTDLAEQVFLEAEQYFQQDMAEVYFRYQELPPTVEAAGRVPVIMAGAKREIVEQHVALIRSLGLRVGVVDCDALAAANMFEFNYPVSDKPLAIINVGASGSQIVIIRNGGFQFSRDVPIGGEEYTRQLVDALKVEYEEGEALKITAGLNQTSVPEDVQKVLNAINEQLIGEIRGAFEFYQQGSDTPDVPVIFSHVFLTGGGSKVAGLDAAIAAAFQAHVQVVNPFYRVTVNPKQFEMEYVLRQGHLYGIALGLALRSTGDEAAA